MHKNTTQGAHSAPQTLAGFTREKGRELGYMGRDEKWGEGKGRISQRKIMITNVNKSSIVKINQSNSDF